MKQRTSQAPAFSNFEHYMISFLANRNPQEEIRGDSLELFFFSKTGNGDSFIERLLSIRKSCIFAEKKETMKPIHIAFSGIGAVGGYYGGRLAAAYQNSAQANLYFFARGRNLEAIRQEGLIIHNGDETILCHPTLSTDYASQLPPLDYLFCCTKGYDLSDNLMQLKPAIHAGTVIIPLLNGANISEQVAELFPQNQVWQGCVYIGARLLAPGVITKFSAKERFFFGSSDGDKEQQEALLQLLLPAGINAFNPDEIDLRIWKKFVMISTAATITSYYDLTIDKVIEQHYDEFLQLGEELRLIATAKGIHLPDDIATSSIETQKMMPAGSTTSMHADFQKGGRTELESLTGYVVRCGEELGVATPLYNKMYERLRKRR